MESVGEILYRNHAVIVANVIDPIAGLKVARLKPTPHLDGTRKEVARERVEVLERSTDFVGVGVVGSRGGNGGRDEKGGEESLRELHLDFIRAVSSCLLSRVSRACEGCLCLFECS